MAWQFRDNGQDRALCCNPIHRPRAVQEAAARGLPGTEYKAEEVLGGSNGRYNITDPDVSTGLGQGENGGHGEGLRVWQFETSILSDVGGRGAQGVVQGVLADTVGGYSIRWDVILHL